MEKENYLELEAGESHYKAYVGPPKKYDLVGAMQFNLLTSFGLRENHKLLDIGCGSLRSGKLLIPFLKKGNYFGIEPNKWLVEDGIKYEVGKDLIDIKSPKFHHSDKFDLGKFEEKFDFLIAQSIFSHTSSDQLNSCLKEAKKVMNKKALFLATFVLGDENYCGTEWVYPGCVTFKHEYILEQASKNKLFALKTAWNHPNGQTWYLISHPEYKSEVLNINEGIFNKHRILKKHPLGYLKKYTLFNNTLVRSVYRLFKN